MSRVRVAAFSISIDGFGAGPRQDLQNPLGVRGTEVHDWLFHTEVFKKMQGQGGWPSLRPRLPVATTTEGGPSLRILQGRGTMLPTRDLFLVMRAFWVPPFANCAKDGARTVLMPASPEACLVAGARFRREVKIPTLTSQKARR
jgi:hypothetical protein